MSRLLSTDRSHLLLAQRVVLGLVMLPHGLQKLLGWFGGFGLDGTLGYFSSALHIPTPIGALVIASEVFGSLALLVGFGTRLAALGSAAVMVGAVLTSHVQHGLFMNWFGNQKGEGFEYHLIAVALAASLVVQGGGAWALDRLFSKGERAPQPGQPAAAWAP